MCRCRLARTAAARSSGRGLDTSRGGDGAAPAAGARPQGGRGGPPRAPGAERVKPRRGTPPHEEAKMKITTDLLTDLGAQPDCEALRAFAARWPGGVELTRESVAAAQVAGLNVPRPRPAARGPGRGATCLPS